MTVSSACADPLANGAVRIWLRVKNTQVPYCWSLCDCHALRRALASPPRRASGSPCQALLLVTVGLIHAVVRIGGVDRLRIAAHRRSPQAHHSARPQGQRAVGAAEAGAGAAAAADGRQVRAVLLRQQRAAVLAAAREHHRLLPRRAHRCQGAGAGASSVSWPSNQCLSFVACTSTLMGGPMYKEVSATPGSEVHVTSALRWLAAIATDERKPPLVAAVAARDGAMLSIMWGTTPAAFQPGIW